MNRNLRAILTGGALACAIILGASASASAQGRGHGGVRGVGGRPPAGVRVGVDGGIGASSDASDRSGGRADAGLERARMRDDNARRAERELRDHPEMARHLHTTANDLRAGYQAALATNPNLKFGQYVAATRLAANLGDTHPSITRNAILAGLAGGRSIGRTLRDLGLGSDEAREAERRVNRQIKESKRRS